jgi:hypothetical protein
VILSSWPISEPLLANLGMINTLACKSYYGCLITGVYSGKLTSSAMRACEMKGIKGEAQYRIEPSYYLKSSSHEKPPTSYLPLALNHLLDRLTNTIFAHQIHSQGHIRVPFLQTYSSSISPATLSRRACMSVGRH